MADPPTLPGPATPVAIVSDRPILPGSATPVVIVGGGIPTDSPTFTGVLTMEGNGSHIKLAGTGGSGNGISFNNSDTTEIYDAGSNYWFRQNSGEFMSLFHNSLPAVGFNVDQTLFIKPLASDTGLAVVDGGTGFKDFKANTFQHAPLTVATLPASPAPGTTAYVTDGDAALAWGATVVNSGSGATHYLVWYNGANWTVTGK